MRAASGTSRANARQAPIVVSGFASSALANSAERARRAKKPICRFASRVVMRS
jgi:hypothetical protein